MSELKWSPDTQKGGKKDPHLKNLPTLPKHCFIRTEPRLKKKKKNALLLKNLDMSDTSEKLFLKNQYSQKVLYSLFMIFNPFV